MNSLHFLYIFILIAFNCFCQEIAGIKYYKPHNTLYFFQKGTKSDTISDKEHRLFYLIVPDSIKDKLLIQTYNAQIKTTSNDSIVEIIFLPGLKYESRYEVTYDHEISPPARKKSDEKFLPKKKRYSLVTLIDGVSSRAGNKITIVLVNKKTNSEILRNDFFYISKGRWSFQSSGLVS